MLHPRVPPLIRSVPHLETLSLFRAEESNEEAEARETAGLDVLSASQPSVSEPVNMDISPINLSVASRSVDTATPSISPGTSSNGILPREQPVSASTPVTLVYNQRIQNTMEPPPESLAWPAPPMQSKMSDFQSGIDVLQPGQDAVADDDEEMPAIDMQSDSESE